MTSVMHTSYRQSSKKVTVPLSSDRPVRYSFLAALKHNPSYLHSCPPILVKRICPSIMGLCIQGAGPEVPTRTSSFGSLVSLARGHASSIGGHASSWSNHASNLGNHASTLGRNNSILNLARDMVNRTDKTGHDKVEGWIVSSGVPLCYMLQICMARGVQRGGFGGGITPDLIAPPKVLIPPPRNFYLVSYYYLTSPGKMRK